MVSCKKKPQTVAKTVETTIIDSSQIDAFFARYPAFKTYQDQIKALYKKHDYHYVWYDKDGRVDFAEVLFNKVSRIELEGVQAKIPYENQIEALFAADDNKKSRNITNELLISSMYFFYTKKVLEGVDTSKSKETGWFLPREKVSYVNYLDSLIKDPNLIKHDKSEMIAPYYLLRKALQHYREIQKKGGWGTVSLKTELKQLNIGDTSKTVTQVRKRLFLSGDLKTDSGSNKFDAGLLAGIHHFLKPMNKKPINNITPDLVKQLNISVEDRIKTIIVNMERCRWIDPDYADATEFIAVNIPSYRLQYIKNRKPILISNVVVGKDLNKTVVFSGQMSYIVFSPYWNIPKSILEKEIKPGIAKNSNYLAEHNMEWKDGNVRQKPGGENSLGLVKFMFPNTNNIYLHDTPAKSLFNKENRAFSHGCIRVEKARDLAIAILKNDKKWNPEKIDAAMHAGTESQYVLQHKIPVYIAYFTAWPDAEGNIVFYEDVYKRDDRLASLLYTADNTNK
jgi:murein L,D-transpeptidase YcbB/YkuD